MERNSFDAQLDLFYKEFGQGRTMVLSTSENGRVSSRMMSVVRLEGLFCFQTDIRLRKYRQLQQNSRAALCIDNIQIEGICEEAGRPSENEPFCETFRACFPGSYRAYSSLEDERVFALRPLFIERWIYKEGVPCIETFDLVSRQYTFDRYSGR